MNEATFSLTKYFVALLEDQEMWGVFSAFDIPIKPISEWYTEEEAIAAAKVEEAAWEAKRQY
jgi:hypothetical protein